MSYRSWSLLFSMSFMSFLVSSRAVTTTFKYLLIRRNVIPTGIGVSLVGAQLAKSSVMKCSISCSSRDDSVDCHGFIFESASCVPGDLFTGDRSTGRCQPVTFADPASVVLIPATSDCSQGFYVANPCWTNDPCLNGGTCTPSDWPRFCRCRQGYNGTYCESSDTTTASGVITETAIVPYTTRDSSGNKLTLTQARFNHSHRLQTK